MPQDKFLNEVGQVLSDLGFEAYWPNDPIPISELQTSITKPDEVEIDVIAKLGKIGFLIEATTQKDRNREKINKFLMKSMR